MKKFNMLNPSSKFAICGLPLRVDSYKGVCGFNCAYCFSNNRKIMEFEKNLSIGNISALEKRLKKIEDNNYSETNFVDKMLSDKLTWHIGGMCDPLQSCEEKYGITAQMLELMKQYGYSGLISTKSNTLYNCKPDPQLHSFQLSITNVKDRKDVEHGVGSIESRYKFFHFLKDNGFKVGIRIQPFIPGITSLDVIEMFKDADHFTIEGIKMVPQNKENIETILTLTGLSKSDFKNMGLYNLNPDFRLELYKPYISLLEEYGLSYSISDNDLRYLSNNDCCCGDALCHKFCSFNPTALIRKYGKYTLENAIDELGEYKDCNVKELFTSNRQAWGETAEEYLRSKYDSSRAPFSPKFIYK